MSKRLEAAVKAWDHHWGDRYGDEALEEMGEEVQVALDAADAVMFSEDAVERVAEAIWDSADPFIRWSGLNDEVRATVLPKARAAIAALKSGH